MRWSIKIARIAGTEIRIHVTFLLFLAWIGFTYYQVAGIDAATAGVVFILALFGCVLLHELGHAIAARAFGIRTPDITLLPIGGVARLQRMPDKPWQELIVAIAGPMVNFVIAAVLVFILGRRADFEHLQQLNQPGITILDKLASINISLALFNLLPAFPMDGGRVLRSLLAMTMNYTRATQIAAGIGQALAFLFGFIGLFTNPMLVFIALFIYLGAQQESIMAQMKDLSMTLRVSDAMLTDVLTLPWRATLDEAVEMLLRTSQHEFPVLNDAGRVLGVLTRDDMIAALKRHGPATPVTDIMHRNLPAVGAHDRFDEAYRLMQAHDSPVLPVVDRHGRLLGLVTTENVGETMFMHSLRPRDAEQAWRGMRVAL
ncbi:MAG: site-2 protease family protein [Ignavibacteria bacterium]|nr:MAG: site-2 protease family protein [Ignavibacteria bacterium]